MKYFTKVIVLLIIAFLLPGCCWVIIGDGYFKVKGEIVSDKTCQLQLYDKYSQEKYREYTVRGRFEDGFVISPCPKTYTVRISCDGNRRNEISVVYGSDYDHRKVHDLGKIFP